MEVGDAGGTGEANYITKWEDSSTLTTGSLYDDGRNVLLGTTTAGALLTVHTGSTDTFENLIVASSPGSDYYFKVASNGRMHFRGNSESVTNSDGKTKVHIQHSGHTGANAESRMIWDNSGGSNQFGWGQGSENADLTMKNYGTATNMMRFGRTTEDIELTGDVGINTTPTAKLHVSGSGGELFKLTNR